MDPLSCQVLYHNNEPIIVSRFTTFTENFVIGCNQITNIFCSKYGCTSVFSARSPCDLGLLAYVAISVFREVTIKLCLPDTIFLSGSEADS